MNYKYKKYLLVFKLDDTNSFYIGSCDEIGFSTTAKLMRDLLAQFKQAVDNF